ncbi:MAG: 30S ribosomal protein S12 methylthiotransferase RimO [Candidatus Omnitrophota bacterium]|nr:MAG: 30S ribosomal protein S12 methylthiotransferase RimO [Candidatus Omnitrophota bacterium]
MATQSKKITRPNKTNPDIFIISLGCPRNLVDSEVLIGKLKEKKFRIRYNFSRLWRDPEESHREKLHSGKKHCIAIVNTCGFIEDAKSESIDTILELVDLKKQGDLASLIVTGCLSQRFPRDIMKEIKEIDAVFGSGTFQEIPHYIDKILNGEKPIIIDKTPRFLYNHRSPRCIMTPKHTVYVKIQEGCKNRCTYCVIPKIRGPYRSRSMNSVLNEIHSLRKSGAKEINLIGQDTTFYGMDRYKTLMLATLLRKASQIMKSGWIRLLYTHPAHYNRDLIEVIKNEPNICKYLDLPIQHISDRILKRMNRHVTKKDIITLIEKLRKDIPGIAIRTSIIIGFPGESDKEFNELEKFLKEIRFDRLGAFIYSREEGTRAFDFGGQVPDKEKHRRFKRIMELQKNISFENNKAHLGRFVKVLIDEKDFTESNQYLGRTEHDAPDVDGLVYVKSKIPRRPGDFINVKIEDVLEYDLVGSAEGRVG